MDLYEAINKTDTIAEELINGLRQTSSKELGLDPRAAYRMYADRYSVAVRTSDIGSLNYYGGFEYIDKEHIKVIGDYTFFLADADRVQDCLDRLEDNS